ncbi:MAG: hypothetical protein K9N23_22115 [Akkermansiaceae bacterium]|nr:hypothetical protein [Akkermansiaceae bacterium]MCF7734394.1 hypothetical protein [Akkermansiaceae bacterium]
MHQLVLRRHIQGRSQNAQWANGSVRGLKVRGNIAVDITWESGKVTHYKLSSPTPKPVHHRLNGEEKVVTTEPGG